MCYYKWKSTIDAEVTGRALAIYADGSSGSVREVLSVPLCRPLLLTSYLMDDTCARDEERVTCQAEWISDEVSESRQRGLPDAHIRVKCKNPVTGEWRSAMLFDSEGEHWTPDWEKVVQ